MSAIGFYAWDEEAKTHLPFALNILTFRGSEIVDVVAFANRAIDAEKREAYHPVSYTHLRAHET